MIDKVIGTELNSPVILAKAKYEAITDRQIAKVLLSFVFFAIFNVIQIMDSQNNTYNTK